MTGTDLCVNKCKQSQLYLNHLVLAFRPHKVYIVFVMSLAINSDYFSLFQVHFIHHNLHKE